MKGLKDEGRGGGTLEVEEAREGLKELVVFARFLRCC